MDCLCETMIDFNYLHFLVILEAMSTAHWAAKDLKPIQKILLLGLVAGKLFSLDFFVGNFIYSEAENGFAALIA